MSKLTSILAHSITLVLMMISTWIVFAFVMWFIPKIYLIPELLDRLDGWWLSGGEYLLFGIIGICFIMIVYLFIKSIGR